MCKDKKRSQSLGEEDVNSAKSGKQTLQNILKSKTGPNKYKDLTIKKLFKYGEKYRKHDTPARNGLKQDQVSKPVHTSLRAWNVEYTG